ncbi:MAG: vWA domain-containing protein [Clostridia bacterium]
MKIMKKWAVALILVFLLISTTCFAASTSSKNATLEIVENNIGTISINDIANFEKKMISSDLTKKELTIQLKITNTAQEVFAKPTEIFLVIDNSLSMKDEVSANVTRLKAVTDSAKTLASALLKNENVKVGVVSFSTGEQEGTITDATLQTIPTNKESDVLSNITKIAENPLGARTNIDAGITLANQNFTQTAENRYIILLTDGVPNAAIDGPILTYSGEVATKTKAKLQKLSTDGISLFSLMTGVPDIEEPSTGITYKALAEEIFGTTAEPTAGKFYYISDDKIEETISQTILSDITNTADNTLTDLDIYDYFPQEILDNFDFSYVTSPNLGNVSAKVDMENRCIVWHLDTLLPQASGILSYKLTLKENIDTAILDKVLATNQKIEITSPDIQNEDGTHTLTSTVSPKVKVSMPKVQDNTIANTTIPQTGESTSYIFIGIVFIGVLLIGIRFYHISKNTK